ncbi:MAG: phosphate ABC transporter ATP-binding protein [Treponema sp.]|nr:phosphate ABC transporter ATP-binding protein [Treponema sp.]
MSPEKISLKNVNFYYDKKQVIYNLNLSIPANEITAIFGPANSGITTLLRALNRLSNLDSGAWMNGEILLDGNNINDQEVNVTELRRKIGMVFEVPTPLPISIFDNIAYGPRLIGKKSKKELIEIVETSLQKAALWDEVKDRLSISGMSLSGGQQQRLCIARVLALEPEVILLDRACSGLDPISTAKIEESLMQLKEQFTIIIAPHNVQQAGRVCDKAVFMLMGHLTEEGSKADVFMNPKDQRTSDYISGKFG